jgi:alpha-glucan,water dikinase
MSKETIKTRSGLQLTVETRGAAEAVEVSMKAPVGKRCLLHWGVRHDAKDQWRVPPQSDWPPGSSSAGQAAVQTPFAKQNGEAGVVIHLSPDYTFLDFALFFPDEGRWDNNDGRNYHIALAHPDSGKPPLSPLDVLRAQIKEGENVFERTFDIDGQWQLAAIVSATRTGQGGAETARGDARPTRYRISLLSNAPGNLMLHWGIARRSPNEWLQPPESMRGPNTTLWQNHTAQTPFSPFEGWNILHLEFPEADVPLGVQFVLNQKDDGGRWFKNRGGNFYVPIRSGMQKDVSLGAAEFTQLADEIIRAEMAKNSWTLMHRFNLCYDMLDRVRNNVDGLAVLFVWLRFSAIRQLTWQRNYNTKPRELAHSQDRLTQKFAELFRSEPASRPLARLCLTTVGRGGEGQRIRDEILNIMHRRHIKEVSGHFLEEWHQKLHNNTTPDDVVICQAYIEFLNSNGNQDRFYQVLRENGVTRERLESFERPIRSSPQFFGHLKDGLLHDFWNFLKILKASHSGTDFETAINAARGQLDGDLQGLLGYIWDKRNDSNVSPVELAGKITEARRRLSNQFNHSGGLRELLYLDLALEQLLRAIIERNIHLKLEGKQLTGLIALVLENVTSSYEDPELAACSRHWARLQSGATFDAEWSRHAKSVADRIGRALSASIDRFYQLLQPKAEYLGHGFHAEDWTIQLFSEEVVRGASLGFALSTLLRHLDPLLRKAAHMGNWQIVSRGHGAGKVEVVDSLRAIQRAKYDAPTIIVTDKVMGDEDIPDGVTAVIAPDVTDIVSHVAVRARNANLLFASCHDNETLEHLKSLRGHFLQLDVSPAGDVVIKETTAQAKEPLQPEPKEKRNLSLVAKKFGKYALAISDFNEKVVGGKSLHLIQLRGQLPNWIEMPKSVAVPFGVFEKVLTLTSNKDAARQYNELVQQADKGGADTLAKLRECVLTLRAPDELKEALQQTMTSSGLEWPTDWEKTWNRIKQVWASKWNDRAYLSRARLGVPHESLFMAVLVQQVVPADYAFVIHTVNPSTGNKNELFAEVVLGLGETLVGNYPGRALSFVWDKTAQKATILSYPSKSVGLYGSGLIFRSDSNGEDLEGYAGAGLYDSVLLDKPREAALDYAQERLVWDQTFREQIAAKIAQIGLEVERACGSAQDVEGAVAAGKYYVVQTRPQVGLVETAQGQASERK